MTTLTLTRTTTNGKAVNGLLSIPYRDGNMTANTIENADYLIPEGTYELDYTWSPKFKKPLPEVMDVPNREGIRIHMGTIPEHSTGCILVDFRTMQVLHALLKNLKYREDEKVNIEIIDGSVCT